MSDSENESSEIEENEESNSSDLLEETDLKENSSDQAFVLLPPPHKRLSAIAIIREIQGDLEAMESALTERYTVPARTEPGEETPIGAGRALGRPTSRTALLVDSPIALVRRKPPKPSRRLLTNSWRYVG